MKKRICPLLSLLLCFAMLTACSAANNGKDIPDAGLSGDLSQTETENSGTSGEDAQSPHEAETETHAASALRFSPWI